MSSKQLWWADFSGCFNVKVKLLFVLWGRYQIFLGRNWLSGKVRLCCKTCLFTGDVGDNVIVINTQDIAMEGDYWERWRHFSHSG